MITRGISDKLGMVKIITLSLSMILDAVGGGWAMGRAGGAQPERDSPKKISAVAFVYTVPAVVVGLLLCSLLWGTSRTKFVPHLHLRSLKRNGSQNR